jgi:maleylacetate reductase
MDPFVYTASAARVVFGSNTRTMLTDEVRRLGCRRALVLSTPQQRDAADAMAMDLGDLSAGTFALATMHTPVEVTKAAVAHARELSADCVISLGGGSTIGLGKAIALNTDLPQIVLPTTYAGSEATSILGQTENGIKTTLRSPKVLPEVIIYDVDLTLTLPEHLTAVSGINAIAHAVEALYAADRNPIISMLAEEGIRALARSLPVLMQSPGDRQARADALYGAWLCGTCLNAVSMGLHHKLCHTLGGAFDLPHAETHTVILPHVIGYNATAAPDAMIRMAHALYAEDATQALFDLARQLGAPTALSALGLKRGDLDRAAALATHSPYSNPALATRDGIRRLLEDAFDGVRPSGQTAKDDLHA